MRYPNFYIIKQNFIDDSISDIDTIVQREIKRLNISNEILSGASVALTAGSRGISQISEVIKSVVKILQLLGAKPFIIPAMGSHGGGTAEGQVAILASYGITEANINAPIVANMEVELIGNTNEGISVFLDKAAFHADFIVPINRIKPHTDFTWSTESGILKMLATGLGKKVGAETYHKETLEHGYGKVMQSVGRTVLQNSSVLFGLGLIENSLNKLSKIVAILPDDIEDTEKQLLIEARNKIAKLPNHDIDVLILDEIGKNVSGTGMDPNVTGRGLTKEKKLSKPRIKRIIVRELSAGSNGNANGIGLADFVTERLVKSIDFNATYTNCLTGMFPEAGKIPITYKDDKSVLDAALSTIGNIQAHNSRIVWIRNTSKLSEIIVSEQLFNEITKESSFEFVKRIGDLHFDNFNNLISPFQIE